MHPGGDLDLPQEAVGAEDFGEMGLEYLERNRALVPAVLTLEVRDHVGHTLRRYRPFQDTTCTTTTVAEVTTLTCALARGIGVFAVDLDVSGALAVTARISAPDNGDPDPANDVLTFGS